MMRDWTLLGKLNDCSCMWRRGLFARLCGLRGSVVGDLECRGCGTFRERGEGYERGVHLTDHGSFVHVFGSHGLVDETHLAGVVLGEFVGYVESHTRRGDGADFEVIEYQQWRFGASVDFDSGVGVRGGHRTPK